MSLTSTKPTPTTWTIRLKYHKTTILLHASVRTTLPSVKSELLAVLQEVSPSGLNGFSLPDSAEDITFAKPVDPLDMTHGWESLEPELDGDLMFDDDEPAEGGEKISGKIELLGSFGVKDGTVLAFRWKGMKEKGWNVVQPTFMDEYGVENEGDMGVRKEFRG